MKAIRIHEAGGPEVMRVEELPTPQPGPGQALVRIGATGVNFIDTYQRSGQYRIPLPTVLGMEAAGTVEAVGEGVTNVAPGDRVAWAMIPGSYSTHAVVPADRVVPVPAGVDDRHAAAAMLQGMTAHYLAYSTHPLQPGDTCLVHAAGGGAGALLVQMLKQRGMRVIGTAGREETLQVAREAGADEVISYTTQDFVAEVQRLTDGKGVAAVYDSVGRNTFEGSLNCLRPRGSLVLFGQSSGAVPPFDPQILNAKGSLWLTRPTLANYIADPAELRWRASDILDWIQSGKLKLRIDRVLPLEQAAEAHRALESRQTKGKVVLEP